jgi:non-ribosomal peptide synthetase component F
MTNMAQLYPLTSPQREIWFDQLSYRELNRKANQLAHYLRGLKNGTDNGLIAIAVERSFSMVIGLLAILKTGGAYVPIDPSYPPARIRYMLIDFSILFI